MKKIKRLVGLLLCIAMVLSFVPATIIGAAAADNGAKAVATSGILEKIDLSGTVVGTCSSPYSSSASYANQNWYSTQNPGWKTLEKFVNGNTSDEITYSISSGERGDVYLDLTKKDGSAISATQFKMYYGAGSSSASMPSVTVILELADGSTEQKTFTTNWSGTSAGTPIEWDFGETLDIEGIYAYTPTGTKFSVAEIELYGYVEVPYLETANLNGVDIGEYTIVYSNDDLDYAYTAAEYIQEQILMRTGRQVEIVEDNTAESTYEIQVGNVNRTYAKSISAPSETAMKFTFASNGTKIALKADYFIIAGAAYYFIDTYVGTTDFNVTANTGVTTQNTITKPAKNFIFMIGDGMGEMHTRLFEIYDVPTSGSYDYSDGEDIFYGYYLPYFGWQKTANIVGEITDSAAAGTALSTGYKTINGYIGKDQYLNDVKNMSELAMEFGKSVAVMSTEGCDGATPAAYSSHADGRYNEDEIYADHANFGGLLIDNYNNYSDFTASEFEEWDALFKSGLNAVKDDPDGFFIMYEEAHIDKVSHRLNYTSSAGYTGDTSREVLFRTVYRFNQAIGTFMEYALYNPDTMVLITADHETSGLNSSFIPTEGNPVDEQQFGSVWNHSLKDVPVFSYGAGAEIFHGVTAENASYARTWADLMTEGNADDFGNPEFPIIGEGYTGGGSTNTVQPLPSSKITNPQFGYYADGNTNGSITPYYQSGREPAYLIDGGATNQARSQYYLYSEIANKTKIPAIQLDLTEATVLTGIKINGYEYGRYNMEDFEVQVYTESGWATVASWDDAFVNGTNGNDVSPLLISFQQPVTATKVRILISQITDMSAEAYDDADSIELLEGSYIRVKEVTLYYDTAATPGETPDPDQPTTNPTQAPTQTPTLPEGGELEQGEIYKIINNATYLTGWAGYVNASGTLVEVSGEGECLVEGAYGRCAYLNENISGETAAVAEITMSKTFKVGAIEITGDRNTQADPTNFEIQAYINGVWTTVKSVTNAFASGSRTQRYTFGPVETNKIRLYITSHEGSYCSIGEIELFEVTTGNIANKIDLSGANVTADSGVTAAGSLTSAVVGSVTDGDKSTIVTFNSNYPTIAIDLTKADGTPTNVSAFSLFGNRSGNRPTSVEIQIQTTNGGSYTSIGTYSFSANNVPSYPFQPYYTELGASYDVYGLKVIVKSLNYAETAGCALAEIELYGGEEGATPDEPTTPTEPTTPPATQPTTPPATEPAEGTMQKIDLTGTVVGVDSQDSASKTDFTTFTWYSDANPGWKDITIPVNGNYDDEIHWGLDPHERADIYLDLTRIDAEGVAASQLKLYHSKYRDVPSLTVILKLADGTFVEKVFELNWKENVAADPFVYTFDETYTVTGVYLWENENVDIRATFGEIEMYYRTGDSSTTEPTEPTEPPVTEPTEPTEAPTAPAAPSDPIKQGNILQIVPASKITTQFGYYSDYSGDDETTFVDCLDGYCVTDGWYGRAGYSECTSADGLIALVMTLDEAKTLGAIELIGKNEENNPKCFDVQAMIDGEWVSVVSRTDDTFVSGLTQAFDFRKTITTSKLRILIYAVVDAKNECYLNEVTLYEATTGNATQTIDLTGKGGLNDADPAHPIGDLVDNNKTTEFLGSVATFDLTVDGQATAVDGFNLYAFRADADGRHTLPTVVTVQIEKVLGGEYETIGTFETGWVLDGITDVLTAKFDQTYMAYSVKFTFDNWSYANELELFQYVRETEPTEPDTILVGASYSIHLIEPWALRTSVQFARNDQSNLIPVSSLTSYGVYAIIGDKFEGATAEELIADPDTVKYTKEDDNITAKDDTTLTFDFYDGLYSFNLDESIYWVAYFEDAGGVHYTGVQEKSLIAVADNLLGKAEVSDAEKAILKSMKEMKDAMTALRGENADLGHIYPAGAANPGTLGDRNTGYVFGTAYQIKLIEPWGIRVRVLMRDKTAPGGVYADYESADDYGLIFFHDKTNKYGGTMTAEQLNAESDAKIFSKQNGNAWINGKGVTAIYDHEIHTYQLDSELYCLPYIVVGGEYYYPSAVICWNLLDEMVEFSQNENLSDEEIAAFEAILKMYENVQNHLN